MTAQDRFNELANLTQLYLHQEYKLSEWIFSEPESYAFFKQLASTQKKQSIEESAANTIKPQLSMPKEPLPVKKDQPIETNPQTYTPSEKKAPAKIINPEGQEPAKAIKPEEKESSKAIKLEVMESPKATDFSDLKAILQEKCPQLKIIEEIPEGSKKQKITSVVILYLNTDPLAKKFYGNLTHAIDTCLAPTSLMNASKIESSKGWEDFLNQPHLKAVLIVQQELDALPKLAQHYTSAPQPMLGKISVHFLPELSLINKDPSRKQMLWSSLESFFTPPSDEKLS